MYGGAVYLNESNELFSCEFTIEECAFYSCYASRVGGTVYFDDGSFTIMIKSCIFSNCYIEATYPVDFGGGGAIYSMNRGPVSIEGCLFKSCSTTRIHTSGIYDGKTDGGSILFYYYKQIEIKTFTFKDSHTFTSLDNGGAVAFSHISDYSDTLSFEQAIFNKSSSENNGGSIYMLLVIKRRS
jgi:hypothetical protein